MKAKMTFTYGVILAARASGLVRSLLSMCLGLCRGILTIWLREMRTLRLLSASVCFVRLKSGMNEGP